MVGPNRLECKRSLFFVNADFGHYPALSLSAGALT